MTDPMEQVRHMQPNSQAARVGGATQPQSKVSIVTPTHYRPASLAKLLDSLCSQTYPAALLEMIVVAHEQDRQAFQLVQQYAAVSPFPIRCLAIADDPMQGKSAAAKRNFGVEQATGDWIAFIDDDCEADRDWITQAEPFFYQPGVGAVEGGVQIPPVQPPTVTYRGLLSLTLPGGYQTCNMFYRRDLFLQLGGFDLNFPFYLEDSDLAWTFIDHGYQIPFAAAAQVSHPVTPPQPWRLWEGAKRAIRMVYLYKKHPTCFRAAGTKVLLTSEWVYLGCYAAALVTWLCSWPLVAGLCGGFVVPLLLLHLLKLFWGCRVQGEEVLVTAFLLPIIPVVKVVQLIRGNWRYKTWLWG